MKDVFRLSKRRVFALAGLSVLAFALGGCAGTQTRDFAGRTPRFEPEKYFAGRTRSWGIVEDRFGKIRREFTAVADGQLHGSELHLDQRFTFGDGKIQRRVWTIRRLDAHHYEGTAADVVGIARGETEGNALKFTYTLALPLGEKGGGTVDAHFTQWMLLEPNGVMINRATIGKFGVRLGTVSEFFQKSAN